MTEGLELIFRRHPWCIGTDVTIWQRGENDTRSVYDFKLGPGPSIRRVRVDPARRIIFSGLVEGATYVASGHGGALEFVARDPEPEATFWPPDENVPDLPSAPPAPSSRLHRAQDAHKR